MKEEESVNIKRWRSGDEGKGTMATKMKLMEVDWRAGDWCERERGGRGGAGGKMNGRRRRDERKKTGEE